MSTTVEVLVEAFKAAGTPFLVGHPGGESVEMMDAARQRDMRFILMKQEIKGIPQYGVKIGGIDWVRLAQGFGADGYSVDSETALGDALGQAVQSGRTTVIGCRIDPSGYVAQFNALREL